MPTTHSPGPWTHESGEIIANGVVIALVYGADDRAYDDEEALANARLIAAAPALLEALEEFVAVLEDPAAPVGLTGHEAAVLGRGRSAVAKAKGGGPCA